MQCKCTGISGQARVRQAKLIRNGHFLSAFKHQEAGRRKDRHGRDQRCVHDIRSWARVCGGRGRCRGDEGTPGGGSTHWERWRGQNATQAHNSTTPARIVGGCRCSLASRHRMPLLCRSSLSSYSTLVGCANAAPLQSLPPPHFPCVRTVRQVHADGGNDPCHWPVLSNGSLQRRGRNHATA